MTKNPALPAALLAAIALIAVGCSGGFAGGNSGNGDPLPTSSYYTYVGTQGNQGQNPPVSLGNNPPPFYGGLWQFSLDDQSSNFSYWDVSEDLATTAEIFPWSNQLLGTSVAQGGFRKLTINTPTPYQTAVGLGGYSLDIPGETAIVRPGSGLVAPIIAVETSGCPAIKATTYQFIAYGTSVPTDATPHVAYGSIGLTTAGTTWNFSSLKMFALDGTDLKPAQLPVGDCTITQAGYAATIAPAAATNMGVYTAAVSPHGYFILDQQQGNPAFNPITFPPAQVVPGPTGPLGLVGMEQPSTAVSAANAVSGKYLGFQFEPILDSTGVVPGTIPVSFGTQIIGSGTVITGGAFPDDDVTKTPPANITIDLGQPDASTNGLFPAVTTVIPDTYSTCIGQPFGGTDANGNPTCILHGIAIVGNPGGKYAIFVTVNDPGQVSRQSTPLARIHFFLYQQ